MCNELFNNYSSNSFEAYKQNKATFVSCPIPPPLPPWNDQLRTEWRKIGKLIFQQAYCMLMETQFSVFVSMNALSQLLKGWLGNSAPKSNLLGQLDNWNENYKLLTLKFYLRKPILFVIFLGADIRCLFSLNSDSFYKTKVNVVEGWSGIRNRQLSDQLDSNNSNWLHKLDNQMWNIVAK